MFPEVSMFLEESYIEAETNFTEKYIHRISIYKPNK